MVDAPGHRGFNEAAGTDPADASFRGRSVARSWRRFNEAAGTDPADAHGYMHYTPRYPGFNEAAGTDPADAALAWRRPQRSTRFNEAAGTDPADARGGFGKGCAGPGASMRPRGQTPRMLLVSVIVVPP